MTTQSDIKKLAEQMASSMSSLKVLEKGVLFKVLSTTAP